MALPVDGRGVALGYESANESVCVRASSREFAGSGGDGGEDIEPSQISRLVPCEFWSVESRSSNR